MEINGLRNPSFGKIYARKKDIEKEIKKYDSNLRSIVRKAVKQADGFEYYDMTLKDGKVLVSNRNFDIPIIEKTTSPDDKGLPFYKALCYLYKKEALEDIYNSLTELGRKEPAEDRTLRIYKKAATSGMLEEMNNAK